MSAGLVGSAIGTPFDTIMVKMQNNNKQYPTTISTINTIFKILMDSVDFGMQHNIPNVAE